MIGERLDPRVATRQALRALVEDPTRWPVESPVVLRNLLMDACGGDVRPWATLLLAARDHGYVDRIAEVRGRGPDAWERLRTQLVVGWVSEGFLQREAAQWAVETWGFALGVIEERQLTIPAPPPPPPTPSTAPTPSARPAVAATATARVRTPPSMAAPTTRRPLGRPVPPPPPLTGTTWSAPTGPSRWPMRLAIGTAVGVPLLALLLVVTGVSGRSRRSGPPAVVPSTVATDAITGPMRDTVPAIDDRVAVAPPAPPNSDAREAPMSPAPLLRDGTPGTSPTTDRTGAASNATSPGTPALRAAPGAPPAASPRPFVPPPAPLDVEIAERSATASRGAPRPAAPIDSAALRTGVGVTSITTNALPRSATDPRRTMYVQPPTRAAGLPNGLPKGTIPMTGLIPAVPTLDALHLRSGRVLRGRVEIIRASLVVFRDADDGLRYEFPNADVESIHTEIGTIVRFDGAGAPVSSKRSALVSRGVSGSYTVNYTVRSVRGSADCRGLWQRPPTADRVTVSHAPGADTLVIAFRGGDTFPSVIDREGYFASTFRVMPDQAKQSTALTTRLNGQFTERGFDGEINVIAYRRARVGDDTACHSIIDMRATREDKTTGASR